MNELFDRLVDASGLNEMVAPFTLSRLLLRADVQPRDLTPDGLERALPEVERGIRVYLTDEEAREALERIRALVGHRGD
jgi:hypothetical protein